MKCPTKKHHQHPSPLYNQKGIYYLKLQCEAMRRAKGTNVMNLRKKMLKMLSTNVWLVNDKKKTGL